MVEPLRHRQTKGAATDMFYLTPPRHISTLPFSEVDARIGKVCFAPINGLRQSGLSGPKSANSGHPPYRHNAADPRFYEFGSQGFESLRARATSEFAIDA